MKQVASIKRISPAAAKAWLRVLNDLKRLEVVEVVKEKKAA